MMQPEKKSNEPGSSGVIPTGGFQAPKGTRDFYPREMMIRRYITDTWRRVSLRHGFDEIDGPTFEHADLYTVKSGDGILSELFSFRREGGEDLYALRPEFTPTLARMYAARARQLPQPTKWFCVSNFFRAERPQRGRLREFFQWNCDVIGDGVSEEFDSESIGVVIDSLREVGIESDIARVRISSRSSIVAWLASRGLDESKHDGVLRLLDARAKLPPAEFAQSLSAYGISADELDRLMCGLDLDAAPLRLLETLRHNLGLSDQDAWLNFDPSIVRGLAYYTGTVFEVTAQGERAVAGGGRYDKLIELFGGPATPACGFGMGDAVLGNLLDDRSLFPDGAEMMEALSRPLPIRPDVFVIASPNEGCAEKIIPSVAALRRGVESEKYLQRECKPWSQERYAVPPLHARRSYKATKNVGKLLSDASSCFARFAAIIETPTTVTLKNLQTREEVKDVPLAELGKRVSAAATL